MSPWLIFAMSAVLVSWAALLAILVGIGLGFRKLVAASSLNTACLVRSPWIGLSLVILFLQAWHFLFAIQWPALAVVATIGAVGLLAARDDLINWTRAVRISHGFTLRIALPVALVALWLSNRAIGPGDAFDSGLYHYNIVRWNHEFPIVPGLANLQAHLGFNSSCHLFDALLQVGPWEGRANHLANGLLLLMFALNVIASATHLLRSGPARAQDLFNLTLAIPLVMYAVSKEASSPTSDLPQAMFAFVAASSLVALHSLRDADAEEQSMLTITVILLSTAALCVKLSAGPLAVPMGSLALLVYLSRRPPRGWLVSTVAWSIGLSVALVLTWVGRSVVLSGYPLFPSKALPMPVEWRVPTDARVWFDTDVGASHLVRLSMLERATGTPAFEKVPNWLKRPVHRAIDNPRSAFAWVIATFTASSIEIALPLLLTIASLPFVIIRAGRAGRVVHAFEWLLFAPPTIALIAWVRIAPEPRFGTAACWVLAATTVSLALRGIRRPGALVPTVAALSLLPIAYRILVLTFNPASGAPRQALIISAGPDRGFHPKPVARLLRVPAGPGLIVNVPLTNGPTWDAPLPVAVVTRDRQIRMRMPGQLEHGFVVTKPAP